MLSISAIVGGAQTGPRIRLTEDLRIDGSTLGFSRLGPVRATATSIYVAELADLAIHEFMPGGQLRRTFGRPGSGPGEFRSIGNYGLLGDTLWVSDYILSRITLFVDGRVAGTIVPTPAAASAGWSNPLALLPGRTAVMLPAISGAALRDGSATFRTVLRGSLAAATIDTLLRVPARNSVFALPVGGGTRYFPQPFNDDPVFAASPDGDWLLSVTPSDAGSTTTLEIQMRDATGRQRYRTSMSIAGEPVSSRSVDSVIAAIRQRAADAPADVVRRALRIPRMHPVIRGALVSGEGEALLRLRTPGGGETWNLLSATGAPIALLDVPAGAEVIGIDRGVVWALVRDADDVPSIVRYRHSRGR